MTNLMKQFLTARRVATPLIAIHTPDPAATVQAIMGECSDAPIVHWDVQRGLIGVNKAGEEAAATALSNADPEMASARPSDALSFAANLPEDSICFMANAHLFYNATTGAEPVIQGIWNLRDKFKSDGRTLVLLSTGGSILPAELSQDVMVLDEPLPTAEELAALVRTGFANAQLEAPSEADVAKAVDALVGLAVFPAEQVLSMSLRKKGLDFDGLWERKRQVIEQAPGLSVWRGGETFADIGGCENVKEFLMAVVAGKEPPRAVVFLDEIEKTFAGSATDSSGTKTEMLGALLTWMQDHEADGAIFIGPPGAAKSAIAKAFGNTAGCPTVAMDIAGMQDKLVGQSGGNLRSSLKVVDAVSQGRAFFVATCNSIASLPPELRRRFTAGTFFFDLPSAEERGAIWQIYMAKYGVAKQALPNDEGWTGAEIKECCRKASKLSLTLEKSATYIVPVSKSAADQIRTLRQGASGKFTSASDPGVYTYQEAAPAGSGRAILPGAPSRRIKFDPTTAN